MKPEELLFAETHEWVHIADEEGDKIATIGISAHAVEALTDLVFMDLPSVGAEVYRLRSPLARSNQLKRPVICTLPSTVTIVEVNSGLPDNLETLNDDPYGEGWIIKVKIVQRRCLDKLDGSRDLRKTVRRRLVLRGCQVSDQPRTLAPGSGDETGR